MIELLERRSGPSSLHERRAATLSTMASLTGHTTAMAALPGGWRPDVLQLRLIDGSLFVGDAKATEMPGNSDTYHRLSRYADSLTSWVHRGRSGVLALAVPEADAYGWLLVLRDLSIGPAGGVWVPGRVDLIELGTAVVWQSFRGRRRTGGG